MSKTSTAATFHAACAQFNVERGKVADNLGCAESGVRAAAEQGAQLIVLPEMWTTSFLMQPTVAQIRESREAERSMTRLSEELGVMIIGGGLEEEKGQIFNRCIVADKGKVLGTYRKIHLFSPNAEPRFLTSGHWPLVVESRLGRIGVVICYDLRFPELTRYYFHKEVEILVVPAQWPEARLDHWRTLIQARAIENQCFVLGCNRTGTEDSLRNGEPLVFPGDSRIADPMGEILATAAGNDKQALAEIELRRVRTMRRIVPAHRDRKAAVYRDLWRFLWEETPPGGSKRSD